jgi:hypothetical protein
LEQLALEITKRILSLPYEKFQQLRENKEGAEAQAIIDARDQLVSFSKNIESE